MFQTGHIVNESSAVSTLWTCMDMVNDEVNIYGTSTGFSMINHNHTCFTMREKSVFSVPNVKYAVLVDCH